MKKVYAVTSNEGWIKLFSTEEKAEKALLEHEEQWVDDIFWVEEVELDR